MCMLYDDRAMKLPERLLAELERNGLQNTKEGLWVLDETNAPTHWVSLVNFADGERPQFEEGQTR